jgi:hypothetical protein
LADQPEFVAVIDFPLDDLTGFDIDGGGQRQGQIDSGDNTKFFLTASQVIKYASPMAWISRLVVPGCPHLRHHCSVALAQDAGDGRIDFPISLQ